MADALRVVLLVALAAATWSRLRALRGSPGEALRLGRRWLSHLEALLKG